MPNFSKEFTQFSIAISNLWVFRSFHTFANNCYFPFLKYLFYITVVLIYIPLTTNDVHLSCAFFPLEKMPTQVICLFFNAVVSFYCCAVEVLHLLFPRPLNICFANIFSHSELPFHFLDSLWNKKHFQIWWSFLYLLSFSCLCFRYHILKTNA